MFLLIGIAVLALIVFIGGFVEHDSRASAFESGFTWGMIALFPLGILLFAGGLIFLTSVSRNNNLTAYSQTNQLVYSDAAEELKEGIPLSGTRFFDAANLKQIDTFGEAVVAERRNTVSYNKSLQTQRYWEKNPFFGIFIPDLDPAIQPIR